jgi:hypothetical protein
MSFKKTLCRIQISQFSSIASVRTMWYSVWTLICQSNIRPDAHQCLETSNCSRFHPSGRHGKSPGRYSEFEMNPAFKCIHPDDVTIPSRRRYEKTATIVWTMWKSRPDAILDKASHTEKVQPPGRQTPWSGCLDLIMEIECNGIATVRTLGQHCPDTLWYFDHNILLKYQIGTKLA